MKPTFLIAGTQKGGTGALYNYLRGHKEIYLPPVKELHYYDKNYEKGLDWYLKFFKNADSDRYKAAGEATPIYMYLEEVPERIHRDFPDIKLIFILRHPVDRAYSHYWYVVARGAEPLSFEEAIEREEERLSRGDLMHRRLYSYLDRGKYVVQLKRYRKYFSKDQMLIIFSKDLREKTVETVVKVLDFIGVSSDDKEYLDYLENYLLKKRFNPGRSPKNWTIYRIGVKLAGYFGYASFPGRMIRYALRRFNTKPGYPPMDKDLRRRLIEYFEMYNRELESYLGVELPWWRE